MRNNANNLAVLRFPTGSHTATRTTGSRLVTTLAVGLGLVAVALLATRSAASEKFVAATDARPEQLASMVAEKQVAARRAIEVSRKLTAAHGDDGEVVMASARIPAGGELLKAPAKSAARVRTIRMVVTAYCPCTKCCGKNAQGITASGKRVSHNNGRFVAADTSVLPFGKKLVIPGYHAGTAVEVLDTGSAIKGKRLDVYFPSHQKALEWGKRSLDVTVID